jgi:hypothetical protein
MNVLGSKKRCTCDLAAFNCCSAAALRLLLELPMRATTSCLLLVWVRGLLWLTDCCLIRVTHCEQRLCIIILWIKGWDAVIGNE